MIDNKYNPIRGLNFDEENEDEFELIYFQPKKKARLKEGEYTRYRNHPVTVRMTQEEKQRMEECFAESGFQKKQNYAIHALCQKPMATDEAVLDMKEILEKLDGLYDQLRKIGVDINQIAAHTYTEGDITIIEGLARIVAVFRKEVDAQWRSSKSLLQRLQDTQR